MRTPLIIPLALLAALVSCGSPLDVATPRIDTRLTNIIKLRDVSISARIVGRSDSITIDPWPYDTAASNLAADTSAEPPTFSLDRRMTARPADAGRTIWLRELRVRLTGVPSEGTLAVNGDPASGSGVSARIMVNGAEQVISTDYNGSCVISYRRDDRRRIQGTILMGAERVSDLRLLIAINFTASQD